MKFTTDSLKELVIEMCENVFEYSKFQYNPDYHEFDYDKENKNKRRWKRLEKGRFDKICDWFDFSKMEEERKDEKNMQWLQKKSGSLRNFGTYQECFLGLQGMEFCCFFNNKSYSDITKDCIVRYFIHDKFQDGNDNFIITTPDDSELVAMMIHSD